MSREIVYNCDRCGMCVKVEKVHQIDATIDGKRECLDLCARCYMAWRAWLKNSGVVCYTCDKEFASEKEYLAASCTANNSHCE